MPNTSTNTVQKRQNLSTIAKNAGLTPAQFAALNPNLANSSNNYQGLNNIVPIGATYYLPSSTPTTSGTTSNTNSSTSSTSNTLNVPSGTYQSQNYTDAQKSYEDLLNGIGMPNENQTYQDTLAKYQAQIDATNQMYADTLARAKETGRGRLGSTTAVSARRGLLGSDFGNAQYNTQENANEDVYRSIENERLAKINAILSQAKSDATAEYKTKRDELLKGAESRLNWYASADQRKQDNTSKAAKAIISQGMDINSVDANSLNQLAKYYGVSSEDIKAAYPTELKAYQTAQKEANKGFDLSAGQQRYEYNTKTGKYEVVGQAPYKPTSTTSGKGTVASREGSDVADIISLFKSKMTQNNWRGINPDDYNKYRTKLLKTYGSAAVNLLDKEIENAGLSLDNG